jgi:hypothetical protein
LLRGYNTLDGGQDQSIIDFVVEKTTGNVMQVGDIVKSLDFNGIDNCYMIGKVVGVYKTDGTFRAEFIKRVWQGVEDKKFKTDFFIAPMQGEQFMDKSDSPRVIVLA